MTPETTKFPHDDLTRYIARLLAEKAVIQRRLQALDDALGSMSAPQPPDQTLQLKTQPPQNWHAN